MPAVESCQVLASNILKYIPEINVFNIYDASFDKLIEIEPNQTSIQGFNQLDIHEDNSVISRLFTKKKLNKTGISRSIEHVKLEFRKDNESFIELPYDTAFSLDGICFRVNANQIYRDLIFFDRAYQNIKDDVYLTSNGAMGHVFAADYGDISGPLGSPFVFDAALHVVNVWVQRYHNISAFPVSFKKRIIKKPAVPGENYFARIVPLQTESNNFLFDIWIYDLKGDLCEAAFGVLMKDIKRSKKKPPEWLNSGTDVKLKNISLNCKAYSVIEINSVPDFAEKALSRIEFNRLNSMTGKRRRHYISARLACKYLSRKLAPEYKNKPAHEIITIADNKYPKCPVPEGSGFLNCSVSHDSRFAVAAASTKRIGVDVEEITEKILKSMHLFISKEEKENINFSKLDEKEYCLRIWSIKEAVTKALDIKLVESWKTAKIKKVGKNKSTFYLYDNEITVYHDIIDNHLFTLVELED